jgi:hypothetical protein
VRGDELEKALSFAKRELEQLQRTAEAEAVRRPLRPFRRPF